MTLNAVVKNSDPALIEQHKRIFETYKIINDAAASRHHEKINSQ